ncbi:MAG: glycine zipper family protein [Bdellovibrionales bacterium]
MHKSLVLGAFLLLAACSSAYEPVVDRHGVDEEFYQQDLAACRAIADQVNPLEDSADDTFWGAGLGALTGAAIGAVTGSVGTGAAIGAVTGGVGGTTKGVSEVRARRRKIIDNCLTNRGYDIL